MFTKLIRKYIDLIKRIDSRQDDEIIVKRFEYFNDVLQPGESIIWQGKPSAKHAWGDHDQMEPAGSVGERPVSLTGRKVEMILALLFILFMFFIGLVSTYAGIDELLHNNEMSTQTLGIFLILTGITFMSGLPFLMRPIFNSLRTRQLTYLLTSSRAMIIRHGHAWAEIWTRSWVIISASLLLLYGVILFSGIFIESSYQDIVGGAGMSTWLARLFILLIMAPVGFISAALGFVGLYFQSVIILDAIKDRHGIFMRAFDFDEIKRNDFPVISRPRKEGVGDVILDQDGHWEYDIDFNQPPWFKINAVGFLSVPHAKQVMAKVERTLSR